LKPKFIRKAYFLPKQSNRISDQSERFGGNSWRVKFDMISKDSIIFPSNANNVLVFGLLSGTAPGIFFDQADY
jgi:hypothetical protein